MERIVHDTKATPFSTFGEPSGIVGERRPIMRHQERSVEGSMGRVIVGSKSLTSESR